MYGQSELYMIGDGHRKVQKFSVVLRATAMATGANAKVVFALVVALGQR
jgi:hypothetical protein